MKRKKAIPGAATLAKDFARWGRRATKRIQAMTKKYGVTEAWSFRGAG